MARKKLCSSCFSCFNWINYYLFIKNNYDAINMNDNKSKKLHKYKIKLVPTPVYIHI